MKDLSFPKDLKPCQGNWNRRADIALSNVAKRDIYRSPLEPSYVSWAILWKERSGVLKLSFTEATGDQTAWPPVYDFNSRDIEYYLKTLVSKDGGETWTDTGWREDMDPIHEGNSDHHIRHVFELPDGTLMRNCCHTVEGVTTKGRLTLYDETRGESGDFHFVSGPLQDFHPKFASIWTSGNGGETWNETYLFDRKLPFFITAIHPLRDGSIVALGALWGIYHEPSTWEGALTESKDGGKSWSEPITIVENDDRLNPQGIGEECDFVEINEGKLLVIWRTDAPGSSMRQLTLERDANGTWQASRARINPFFVHSGYPYMHRASDGTIFYYCISSIKYSCDDGETWKELPPGYSYYGQLTETSPGRILAVTQKNIGDSPYPWRHDTSMLQTTFDYERIGVAEQSNADLAGALARLEVGQLRDFHTVMELRIDGVDGLAYQVAEGSFRFVALAMPASAARLPSTAITTEQDTFLLIGRVEKRKTELLRKIWAGKSLPGAWAELQVSRQGTLLKAAVKLSTALPRGATYTCFKDEATAPGAIALFTNKSTGAFRKVRFQSAAGEIRSHWRLFPEKGQKRIALDAGRAE